MSDENKIDPNHDAIRQNLRVIGPVVVGVGLLFTAIGMVSFFSAFGSFSGPPRYFWCSFVGLPLLAFGSSICKFAYLGTINRYLAAEVAPVQKDTFNYLADGTTEGIKTVAAAVHAGFSEGKAVVDCPKCNQGNDADAKFCKNCGAHLKGQ